MPYPDSADLAVEVFGGYCPAIPPADLPPGASPDCQDVMFPQASVRTRDGNALAINVGAEAISGLADFLDGKTVPWLLIWDNAGTLYQWNYNTGTAPSINGSLGSAGCQMSSTSLFGRKYMAFSSTAARTPAGVGIGNDGGGIDFPRQWDGVNYDRVSQIGPGAPPSIFDGGFPAAIAASFQQITLNILSCTCEAGSNLATATISEDAAAALLIAAGLAGGEPPDAITVAGNAVAGYNGAGLTVISATRGQVQFLAPGGSGLATGAGGTIEIPVGLVTLTAATQAQAQACAVGQYANIATSTVAQYVSAWPIRQAPSNQEFSGTQDVSFYVGMTRSQSGSGPYVGLAAATGTVSPPAFVTAGLRQVAVSFITRQNYITKPSPPTSWQSVGSQLALLQNIPIGPSNIKARLLLFTALIEPPATSGTFFSIESPVTIDGITYSDAMLINDNLTNTVTIDFRDSDLAAGFNGQYLFNQIELGECAAVASYADRLLWMGERNRIRRLLNMSFNGGWGVAGGGLNLPLGWTSDPTYGAGGLNAHDQGIWLDAYEIDGNASAYQGMIAQSAYQDWLGVPIFGLGNYSLRMRAKLKASAGGTAGSIAVDITSASAGTLASGSVSLAALSAAYQTFTVQITAGAGFTASLPADALLRIYGDGIAAGTSVLIDEVQIFPTSQPVNNSIAWVSYAENPEAIDGVTGQITVHNNDGQILRQAFTIRGNLYFGKDRYLASTADDGANEPALWKINEVSSNIGIAGPNAVDTAEEYAVFGNRTGAYIFWGADPIKISQEIQEDASGTGKPCWNDINPNALANICARIDTQNKQIVFGVPLSAGTSPTMAFMMDGKFLPTGESIAGAPATVYSSFTGRMLERGSARKWTPWNIAANCCLLSERPDGSGRLLFGDANATGNVYQQTPGQYSDNGVAIDSYYESYGQPSDEEGQMMQLGVHRHLYDYLTGRAKGSGTLAITLETAYRSTPVRGIALSAAPLDFERPINVSAERLYVMVGTNAVGNWFQLEKLMTMTKPEPVTPVRGMGP